MSARVTFQWPAVQRGGIRLASTALAGMVGRTVPVDVPGWAEPANGTVVAAGVLEDGRSIELTVEVPDEVADLIAGQWSGRGAINGT